MASITVIVWEITQDYDSPHNTNGFADGNYIHCILDDSALTLSVQIRSSPAIGGGTLIASPTDGPQLFFVDGGSATNNFPGTPTPQPFWSRCVGTTLQRISPNNIFPYASIGSTPNSSQCQITPVCDLTISDAYTVTPASGPSEADGSVTISATSSNGTIRYSMQQDFDYASGQASPTFNNLFPGDYTIYAKDEIGCTDEIDITITVTEEYGVRHRFEWQVVSHNVEQRTRIDIEERAYEGEIDDHDCLGAPPFVWSMDPDDVNDPYSVLFRWKATLTLLSTSNGQWAHLFSGDDRKYKLSYYRFESSQWALKQQGFIVPALYSEPYLNPKFYTEIQVSDNIASLSDKDFLDDNGNELRQSVSLIFIIAMILRKTYLNLPIRSCINILEENHNSTDDDDVLAQTYVDSRIFYDEKGNPDNCAEVLQKILEPFGGHIKSALGYWWIVRRENSVGTISYRQFDSNGEFQESGTFDTECDIVLAENLSTTPTNFIFRDAEQIMQHMRHYGKFRITHDLLPDNNLIDSGSFEIPYITQVGGQVGFVDWNVFIGQAGLRYGFEAVSNGDSRGAFFFDLENANVAQEDNILYSKKIRVKSSVFDFSFKYWVEPEFQNLPFVRIAYQVKATAVTDSAEFYLDPLGRWNPTTEHVNDIYVTRYKSWQEFNVRIPAFTSVDPAGYDIEISFYSHNHYGADASDDDFSDLKDIETTGQHNLGRRVYYNDEDAGVLRFYTLKQSFETESTPDRVRPDDYSSPSNQKVWFQDAVLDVGPNQSFVRKVLIDDVVFNQLVLILQPTTYYSDAPNPAVYETVTDQFNINQYEKQVILGDAPSGESGVIAATIPNPEVYRSWLRLSDGTPTELWNRRGVTESLPLLKILLNDVANQMREPRRKLVGTLYGNSYLSPVHSLKDAIDSKRYMIISCEHDDRNNAYRVVLAEVLTSDDGGVPEHAAFTTDFSLDFDA